MSIGWPEMVPYLEGLISKNKGTKTSAMDYGVVMDFQQVTDAQNTNYPGAQVHSDQANFTQADVGKTCWGIDPTNGVNALPYSTYAGTITQVLGPHDIIVPGSVSGHVCNFTWGTDNTAALRGAWNAAKLSATRICYVPAGNYIITSLPFSNTSGPPVSLIGDGGRNNATAFWPSPGFDFSQGGAVVVDGTNGNALSGFSVNLSQFYWPQNLPKYFVYATGVESVSDIYIHSALFATSASWVGIGAAAGAVGVWQDIKTDTLGAMTGISIDGNGGCLLTMVNCFTSNGGHFNISNVNVGGSFLAMIGCIIDEGGELFIANSTSVSLHGCSLIAGAFAPAIGPINIDGTSDVAMFGTIVGCYVYRVNGIGPIIAAGGKLRAGGCKLFGGSNSGAGLTNNGTFYDCGGNKISSLAGSGSWVSVTTNTNPPATG